MPEEAVALDLNFISDSAENLDTETVDQIQQIVSETGFHIDPHREGIMGGTFNFQSFENTSENEELIKNLSEKSNLSSQNWMSPMN